jgi:hypothetical protein
MAILSIESTSKKFNINAIMCSGAGDGEREEKRGKWGI